MGALAVPTNPAAEDAAALRDVIVGLGAEGRTLEALHRLMALRTLGGDLGELLELIRQQSEPAMAKFNAHAAVGEIEQAELYAAARAALVPQSEPMLAAALACNQVLGRSEQTHRYAHALLAIDPRHPAATAALAGAPAAPQHPLLKL